ncbi:hypothetical protein CHS0354_009640 [Potamilus streckersoni]|uniref:Elongation of very long chain fatty acids protein n=1 Tax=Potamilus streckersoni TaxID=2493646 RepID=A0AAE0VQ74_9BIVA|nr:hypothetical protein CHS0354_009640 [Potamilus streckersoni]
MDSVPLIPYLLRKYEEVKVYEDPRTKDWPLLEGTPVPVWIITVIYLLFVYLGPKWMKNRNPYSLQTFMIVYNLSLVGLSVYMFVEILLSTNAVGYPWLCAQYNQNTWKDPREMRVANVLWWFFISKAIELLDTVLMILRKKNGQVTFLHVFHHASILNIWWFVITFLPGGQSYFGACLNCLVHVVMYSYYGLSVIPSLREKLWWKRHITNFQLIQFCITLSHTLQSYFTGCDFPLWGHYLLCGYMIFMLTLFGNFYFHAYIMKKNAKREAKRRDEMSNGFHSNELESNGVVKEYAQNGLADGHLRQRP